MEHKLEPALKTESRRPRSRTAGAPGPATELHPALHLQQLAGNQAMQQLLRSGLIRAKLEVSHPNDPEEQEADVSADRVMRSHAGAGAVAASACTCSEEDACACSGGQKIARSASGAASAAPHGFLRSLRASAGQPLNHHARAFFEPRIGRDFSHVRVHTDATAASSSRAINAHAFAAGSDIFFAPGRYAPGTDEGRRLLAHELVHVAQQNEAPERLCRQPDPAAPANATSPAPTAVPAAASSSIVYEGKPLSPVNVGMTLTPDEGAAMDLLRQMIVEHGVKQMREWVETFPASWVISEEAYPTSTEENKGDVSGAPLPPEMREQNALRKEIVGTFQSARQRWEIYIGQKQSEFDRALIGHVSDLLDRSRIEILAEAERYNIPLEGQIGLTADKVGIKVPFWTAKDERDSLQTAAKQLLALWNKKDEQKKLATALLTPPVGLIEIDRNFALQRRQITSQFPALAAYATSKERLRELAGTPDAVQSLRSEMNKRLDDIAWVRSEMQDHLYKLKLDPGLRASTKRNLQIAPKTVGDRVIEDNIADAQAAQEELDLIKSTISVALIGVALFVPLPGAVPGVLLATSLVMQATDVYSHFEDYLWEEAASGTAFDRASAISHSDPSLLWLGVEIAMFIANVAGSARAIEEGAMMFKKLASPVREVMVARAGGDLQAADQAVARLRAQAPEELEERIEAALARNDAASQGGKPTAPLTQMEALEAGAAASPPLVFNKDILLKVDPVTKVKTIAKDVPIIVERVNSAFSFSSVSDAGIVEKVAQRIATASPDAEIHILSGGHGSLKSARSFMKTPALHVNRFLYEDLRLMNETFPNNAIVHVYNGNDPAELAEFLAKEAEAMKGGTNVHTIRGYCYSSLY
jgi:hypothetical protein